jgi:hypothetical protein
LGSGPSDLRILLPDIGQAVPKQVREANDTAIAGYNTLQQAQHEVHAARAEREQASAIDRAADRTAVAAGVGLGTVQRAEPAAEQALEAASRKHSAAEAAYRDELIVLARTIHKHRDSWTQDQKGVVRGLQREVLDALTTVTSAYDRLTVETSILAGVQAFPPQGTLIGFPGFGWLSPHDREMARRLREQQSEESRQKGGYSPMAPKDVPSLRRDQEADRRWCSMSTAIPALHAPTSLLGKIAAAASQHEDCEDQLRAVFAIEDDLSEVEEAFLIDLGATILMALAEVRERHQPKHTEFML